MQDEKQWSIAWARFDAFRDNLPSFIKEESVNQYHGILGGLQTALGEPLEAFKIPDEKVAPKIIAARRAGFSGRPGHVTYSKDKYCDSEYFKSQVDGLWKYLAGYLKESRKALAATQEGSIRTTIERQGNVST